MYSVVETCKASVVNSVRVAWLKAILWTSVGSSVMKLFKSSVMDWCEE